MRKIAIPVSRDRLDSTASSHFGKAKWLLVSRDGEHEFVRNEGLNGRSVAEQLAARGCTDAIAAHAGGRALAQLHASGIRTWTAPEGVPAAELVARLEAGSLEPLRAEAEPHAPGVHPCIHCAKAH